MKKASVVWWLVAVAVGAGGFFWWRSHSAAAAKAAEAQASRGPAPQAVTVFTAQQRDMPVTLDASGTVVPLTTVEVRPQLSSTVSRVAIKEGQFVKQGELLFTFDDRSDQANVDKAQATVLHDRATLADLARQLKRNQELKAQNFISQGALDTLQSQYDAQKALLASDEAAVRGAQVSAGYGSLRAPMAGRTGAIAVHPGSLVSPTGDALVTISQLDPIGVSFTVPEAQLPALLSEGSAGVIGASLKVARPATVTAQRELIDGKVAFIDNTVDPTSGTIKLKAEVANARQLLWPGQYVSVQLTLATLKGVTVVPQSALILSGADRRAYVVDPEGKAQLRDLKLRYASGEFAVVEGIKPGEKVVMEGKQNLRPGTPVKVSAPAKAGAASDAASGAAPLSAPASGA
ncbi:efflux RND transporter periplasmic adaptor subunit [Ideonella azotifigens]|uniref:Efflux RND transporter periplasmic adaptor subunit n=1 Tax=Ideonella azotifigens TaxID=513160 RepID=A0ABP3V019_9BURK|nr:efflux RND transporter periplasmic adaptor subunit [Ideonella azotifigens]MCD2340095.1 efflux RND transporter periplasmic adaptor subunit [Ideonella azotifigens]